MNKPDKETMIVQLKNPAINLKKKSGYFPIESIELKQTRRFNFLQFLYRISQGWKERDSRRVKVDIEIFVAGGELIDTKIEEANLRLSRRRVKK